MSHSSSKSVVTFSETVRRKIQVLSQKNVAALLYRRNKEALPKYHTVKWDRMDLIFAKFIVKEIQKKRKIR